MDHWLDKVLVLLQARTSNLKELARIAGSDHRTFYIGIDVESLDLQNQDISEMRFSQEPTVSADQMEYDSLRSIGVDLPDLVDRIKAAPRQEERIVLLLREVMKHRDGALNLLDAYGADKAKQATEALRILRIKLSEDPHGPTNLQLARTVSGLFSKSPKGRTALTYFMLKHLEKFGDVDDWLRGKSVNLLYLSERYQEDLLKLSEG